MAAKKQHLAASADVAVVLASYRQQSVGLAAQRSGLDVSTMSRRRAARRSAAPGIAELFVAACLARLRVLHPKIASDLDVAARARDLTRHEADLAIRALAPRGVERLVTKLATGRWIALGSTESVKRLGRLATWSDAPWILWDKDLASFAPARLIGRYAHGAANP